jgi:hypothetical protein
MKKFLGSLSVVASLFASSSVLAQDLNLDLSKSFSAGQKWSVGMKNGKTYYVMLPTDVEYSALQSIIKDDNSYILVYRWYQISELLGVDFFDNKDQGVFAGVKITKNSITYAVKDNGSWNKYSNFTDFKSKMFEIAEQIINDSKKSIFKNSYVSSFDKINANKLYLIKPKGFDLNINMSFPSRGGTGSSNSSNISGIDTPPSVPF